MDGNQRLKTIAEDLRRGHEVPSATAGELISWFGGRRRGSWVVYAVRTNLEALGLCTEPDFESAYIDSPLNFRLTSNAEPAAVHTPTVNGQTSSESGDTAVVEATVYADPTYRLSKLEAANRPPLSVTPNSSLQEAITLMMTKDYSQLPVMSGPRDLRGIVSWHSIGARLGLGQPATQVREVMDSAQEISQSASLFAAIPLIVAHQYVLVRAKDKSIVGIVTASDLSLQFQQLSEPFLLLGEIENHIRRILDSRLSVDDFVAAKAPGDSDRLIERVSDLTYGEYIRLIENPKCWEKLRLKLDRAALVAQLDRVRLIRNDVMHFDPDGIPVEDLEHLRNTASFLQRLQEIGLLNAS